MKVTLSNGMTFDNVTTVQQNIQTFMQVVITFNTNNDETLVESIYENRKNFDSFRVYRNDADNLGISFSGYQFISAFRDIRDTTNEEGNEDTEDTISLTVQKM
jgi:hypothetical protein